jgi:hypothetical protein
MPLSPQVRQWLRTLDPVDRSDVISALGYFEEFGRSAAEPDVKHRIQTSTYYPEMSEVRVTLGPKQVYRVLVCFGPDDRPVALVGGNKAGSRNAWYLQAVPAADAMFAQYLAAVRRGEERSD